MHAECYDPIPAPTGDQWNREDRKADDRLARERQDELDNRLTSQDCDQRSGLPGRVTS